MSIQPFIPALQSLIPTAALDVVAVYDQQYQQVFSVVRPIKVIVKPNSKLMEHPLESGSSVIDHSIILPTEIDLEMLLPPGSYKQGYEEVTQIFLNRTLLIVQTYASVYLNQVIQSIPHEESSDHYDALLMRISLREAEFFTPESTIAPANPTDNSTVRRGTTQPQTPDAAKQEKASLLYGAFF